ncbi:MAG: M20/M25/M40 family metallo-hydrolase [Clostridiales bacterium]|nr:M20/M25/M40 family metallo-hydrolase [Clostridiales bacterium]
MKLFLILLICALGVLLLLLIIAAVHAALIKAKDASEKPAISYTPEEENDYAKKLSEMVKIPTVSAADNTQLEQFERLHEKMKELFPLIHQKLELTEIDGNLLFRWRGKDETKAPILLMGHQDVVPADPKGWEHGPFSGDIEDGIIYGRGAMDCKSTVAGEFAAVEELLSEGFEPIQDVYLASSVNEEISGDGAEKIVKKLKSDGIRPAVVLDEGGAIVSGIMPGMTGLCAGVGIVEKGYADVKITAKGSGGHSSTPPKNTPIARLAAFISEMEKKRPYDAKMTKPLIVMFESIAPYLSFPMRFLMGNLWLFKPLLTKVMASVSPQAEAFLKTTAVFTMSKGSDAPNVIPREAYVICNLRPAIHQKCADAVAILKKYAEKYDLEVELLIGRDASNIVDTDSEEFGYIRECIKKCFPQVSIAPYIMTGGTDCRHYEVVSDNCIRFAPTRLTKQQLAAMHNINENMSSDALAESVKFYKYFITNRK